MSPHPAIFFLFFVVSGFTALIYESIWSQYLQLFLGHAAYAQSLVLMIFMGGMAAGSWISNWFSDRFRNLLALYGITEGIIGIAALLFHPAFNFFIDFARVEILSKIASPFAVIICKWLIAALTILPQSVLLGMTFPLMSCGLMRLFPQEPGRSLSSLYFANNIGASTGVLVCGFFLVSTLGLPGTMQMSGGLNIILAAAALFMARRQPNESLTVERIKTKEGTRNRNSILLLLFAAFLTGAASFIYEIGWIRMLSLVLGSSTHSFELMLSAFTLGLALGGLWIRKRIDSLENPRQFLATIQVVMGALALSTLPLYGITFDFMRWLVTDISKTEAGYRLFLLASHAIAFVMMLPATFCAGMTLPLIISVALGQGGGERAVGRVYAANTIGAIAGVMFAVNAGFTLLGLKNMMVTGAALDMGLGLFLFWCWTERRRLSLTVPVTALTSALVLTVLLLVDFDPYKMAAGVYRDGLFFKQGSDTILYHRDGKTATVSVVIEDGRLISIRTNGKSDAGFFLTPDMPSLDEPTMILAAALPMALHPNARTVANIGLGSGLTTHVLLLNPLLDRVDTVEIEREVVKAAALFRPRNELTYTDPRSRIHVDDAKSFFTMQGKKYDIIISEPSNPWVSGVASLFSEEFYQAVTRHLDENGVFVQWLQLYEIDSDLVASVLKALSKSFADYSLYLPNDTGDLLIVAVSSGTVPPMESVDSGNPRIRQELKKIGITSPQAVEARKIATKADLTEYLAKHPARANSDYYPVLDQNAARTRFLEKTADDFLRYLGNLRSRRLQGPGGSA